MPENTTAGQKSPAQPAELEADVIIAAGEQLEARGKIVNGWSLRRALGDKGRPDHLDEVWQAHRAPASAHVPAEPASAEEARPAGLPPALAEQASRGRCELAALYDSLILAAFEQADALVEQRHRTALGRIAAEHAELREQLASASASVGVTEAALSEALAGLKRMRDALAESRAEAARAQERARASERQRERDAEAARQQIADLQVQVAALSAAAQRSSDRADATEAEIRQLRGQAARLISSVDEARGQVAATRKRAEDAEQGHAVAQKALVAAQSETAAAKGEVQQLRKQAAQLTSSLDEAHGLAAALKAEVATAKLAAQKALLAAHTDVAASKGEMQRLRRTATQLASDLDEAKASTVAQRQRAEKAEQDLALALEEQKRHEEKTGIVYIA